MLRWILLIPFACLVAMGAGLFFLAMASVASPAVALLIGGGIERLVDALFGLAERGIDPSARFLAVAVNGTVVRRAEWAERSLAAGDQVEIVRPLQGG